MINQQTTTSKQSKPPSDFNDLFILQGVDAVRGQLEAVLANKPIPDLPTPHQQAKAEPKEEDSDSKTPDKNQPFSSEMLLERYALIVGETKVWDTLQHIVMKKMAFKDLVGKKLSEEWLDNPNKKTISMVNVKSAQEKSSASSVGVAGVELMLTRYVLIYGTKDVWDNQTRTRLPAETLKLAWPNEYEFWLKNSSRRKMVLQEQIVFDPTMRADEDCINTFDGLPLTPIDPSECFVKCYGIFQLLRCMCESEHVFNYALRALALPLQKTGTKLAMAMLFHGEIQGAGKSLFFSDIHRQLYGKYSATLGQHQLESQYSDWKSGNLYSVFEEIFGSSGKYQNMGAVKHEVTGKTRRVEKKFVSGWEEANHSNCVFLSNEIQPLPIEPHDRRFLVCWPKQKLDDAILAHAKENMDAPNNEGVRAWYTFLLNLPMSWIEYTKDENGNDIEISHTFHANSEPPMTEAKKRLIEYGLPSWETFYREWKAGRLVNPYHACKSRNLYQAYTRWCSKAGEKNPLSETKFCTLVSVREVKKLSWYSVGHNGRKQATCFIIGKAPANVSDADWLASEIKDFAESLGSPDDPSSPD